MSHDFVDNLRMDRFRGVLLGSLENFHPDQPGTPPCFSTAAGPAL